MRLVKRRLKNKDQTASAMYRLTKRTAHDLMAIPVLYKGKATRLGKLPLVAFFDFVRTIPYRIDPKPREIVSRPAHSIRFKHAGLDCKKKAILMGSWAFLRGTPWRYVASSKRPDRRLHHTYAEYKMGGKWLPMDATYPHYTPAMKKELTAKTILRG